MEDDKKSFYGWQKVSWIILLLNKMRRLKKEKNEKINHAMIKEMKKIKGRKELLIKDMKSRG